MSGPEKENRRSGEALSRYLSAVLDKNANGARAIATSMLEQHHSLVQVFEMISDAQSRVGDLWEQNVIGIEDEHYATDLALQLVKEAAERERPFRVGKRGTALLCCVEGEFHSVGLTMLAELLRNIGWDVVLLGPNQPFSNIYGVAMKAGARIDLICLSVTMPFNIPNLVTTLKLLRSEPALKRVAIMVGGKLPKSFNSQELLVDSHDNSKLADALSSDLINATALATRLIDRTPERGA
jgi:MerR family transcriptional regulator, light-induced transcriptional regulator